VKPGGVVDLAKTLLVRDVTLFAADKAANEDASELVRIREREKIREKDRAGE